MDPIDELAQTLDDGGGKRTAVSSSAITLQSSVLPQVQLVDGLPTFVDREGARFVLEGQLGQGGVGEVLRARDEDIGRSVAIKRLRGKGNAASTTSVARFLQEMRVTGALDHPNVVPIHDVGLDKDGDFFFVMRHVQGETLEAIIKRLAADDPETHRQFGVERRVEIFRGVLEALSYAHSRGYVHRDIKPANIMVGPFGEVVVMDWGIAKQTAKDEDFGKLGDAAPAGEDEGLDRAFQTQEGALVGTPAYMAPEQVTGDAVDARTDIYAASVLLHELLYLEHYLADERQLLMLCNGVKTRNIPHDIGTKSKLQPTVPADLYWFVEMGMRKEPERRFQSVAEMLDRLQRRAAGEIFVQCKLTATRSMLSTALRTFDRYPAQSLIGAVLAVALLLTVFIWAIVT